MEGDDTAYGQALYPVPSEDPNDPLLWTKSKKMMILILCSLYSFLGNSALVGPSVYLEIYSEEFGISVTTASGLVSYPNLVYGFGMQFSTRSNRRYLIIVRILTSSACISQIRPAACDAIFSLDGIVD